MTVRGRRLLAQPLEQGQPVHSGQVDVAQDHVKDARERARKASRTVDLGVHAVTAVPQRIGQRCAQVRVVFNDQDVQSHRFLPYFALPHLVSRRTWGLTP
jgi:hypothetical protein